MATMTPNGLDHVLLCECERCHHIWKPTKRFTGKPLMIKGRERSPDLPAKCPACQSYDWNTPIRYPKISEALKKHFAKKHN